MAVFKCKMCGGDIHAEVGAAFGTCDSCQTTSTLPKANDERVVNLFNRANHFRRLNEFDKALTTYENILNEDAKNAEAHWGVVLCRYGIEYVEDPKTGKRVPTCHRTQHASVLVDADYLAALDNAPDSYTKSLYEEEAKNINEIQKRILAIAANEEPFDVFICYKESTDGGSRTVDSTLAQDIYYQLTNGGFKVFFAKITLEDRLGHEYEPYIFNALNSAKVMLVIGTKAEYFNAVWVRNEWSRYLALMKNDRSRLMIPCYRDMDAYDLPDELSHLQSQDMSKIGFIQDLIRGIKKVLVKDEPTTAAPQAAASVAGAAIDIEALMKRAWLFLEDGDRTQAAGYFDRVLDVNPEHARAYIGKLCASLNIKNQASLVGQSQALEEHPDFLKALRFADPKYKEELKNLATQQKEWADETTYEALLRNMQEAETARDYHELAGGFNAIEHYKNSGELAITCADRAAEIEEATLRWQKEDAAYKAELANVQKATRWQAVPAAARLVYGAAAILLIIGFFLFPIANAHTWTSGTLTQRQRAQGMQLRQHRSEFPPEARAAYSMAVGRGWLNAAPSVFIILVSPIIMLALALIKPSFFFLRYAALAGLILFIVFLFTFASFQRGTPEYAIGAWAHLALYAGLFVMVWLGQGRAIETKRKALLGKLGVEGRRLAADSIAALKSKRTGRNVVIAAIIVVGVSIWAYVNFGGLDAGIGQLSLIAVWLMLGLGVTLIVSLFRRRNLRTSPKKPPVSNNALPTTPPANTPPTPTQRQQPLPPPKKRFCNHCGVELPPDAAKFCNMCGGAVAG